MVDKLEIGNIGNWQHSHIGNNFSHKDHKDHIGFVTLYVPGIRGEEDLVPFVCRVSGVRVRRRGETRRMLTEVLRRPTKSRPGARPTAANRRQAIRHADGFVVARSAALAGGSSKRQRGGRNADHRGQNTLSLGAVHTSTPYFCTKLPSTFAQKYPLFVHIAPKGGPAAPPFHRPICMQAP